MTATTAKRPKPRRAASEVPAPKSTAYGREVLRRLKAMQKLGPWEFGPRIADRIFKR
jgi:hypothetical protein